jgi:DNA-binding response OmpR family regulator
MQSSILPFQPARRAQSRQVALPRIFHVGDATAQWAEIRRSIERRYLAVCDVTNLDQVIDLDSLAAPDLIVVGDSGEASLPHEVCNDLRVRGYSGPILVITGADDPVDTILALESGADAWMPPDVDPHTAVAQIRALLRRADAAPSMAGEQNGDTDFLQVGDCVLRARSRECVIGGREVSLTECEFQLLWTLAEHAGTVVSRTELSRALGHPDASLASRVVDCHVSRLRKRMGSVYGMHIKTIRASGYMLSKRFLVGATR